MLYIRTIYKCFKILQMLSAVNEILFIVNNNNLLRKRIIILLNIELKYYKKYFILTISPT